MTHLGKKSNNKIPNLQCYLSNSF